MRKLVTYAVVVATIVWSLGLAAVVPASAAYSPMSGDLIKTSTDSAIYYIDASGKRNLFVNAVTFWTWYSGSWSALKMGNDSVTIKTISQEDFDALTAGTHAAVRPGTKLIKFQNSPKVYVVSTGNVLREVSDSVAKALFGNDYATKKLITIQNGFETDYSKGAALASGDALPDGSLIKYTGSEDIYFIQDGEKRMVSSDAFIANGFMASSVVTVSSSMSYTTGTSITGEEAALTTVAGTTSTGPVVGGSVNVSLSSMTPASATLLESQALAQVLTFELANTSSNDAIVDGFVIERGGLATDTGVSSIAAFEGSINGTQLGNNKTLNSDHRVTFTDDVTVKAGTTKKVVVVVNTVADLSGVASDAPKFGLYSLTMKSGTSNASLPIWGNVMNYNYSIAIASATVAFGSNNPTSDITPKVGDKDVELTEIKITNGSATEEMQVEKLVFKQAGTVSDSDISEYKLVDSSNGTVLATAKQMDKYVSFVLSSPLNIGKSKNVSMMVKAGEIVDGSSRTIQLDIYKNTDVLAKGLTYNAYVIPTFSGSSQPYQDMTVSQTIGNGSVKVEPSTTFNAANIAEGKDGVQVGEWLFTVKGESVDLTELAALVTITGTGNTGDITNGVFYNVETGTVLTGANDPVNSGVASSGITSTDTVSLGVGVHKIGLKVDLNNDFANNDTIVASLDPDADLTITGDVTGNTITATPSSAQTSSTMTIKTAQLSVSASPNPPATTVIRGETAEVANIILDASASGSDLKVSQLKTVIHTTTMSPDEISNLTLWDGATQLSTSNDPVPTSATASASVTTTWTLSQNLNITKGTVKTLTIKANTAGSTSANDIFKVGFQSGSTVTTKDSEGEDVTPSYSYSDGQAMTIQTTGTITLTRSDEYSSGMLVGNSSGLTIGKLTASAQYGEVNLEKIYVGVAAVTSGGTDEITAAYLVNDETGAVIATASLTSSNQATILFDMQASPLKIAVNTTKGLSIKVDTAKIANDGTATNATANTGFTFSISSADVTAKTAGASATVTSATLTFPSYRVVKSVPKVTVTSTGASIESNGTYDLINVAVTADAKGPVGLYKMTFKINTTTVTASGYTVYEGGTLVATVATDGIVASYVDANYQLLDVKFNLGGSLGGRLREIAAGTTKTYTLKADVTGYTSNVSNGVSTSITGDDTVATYGTAASIDTADDDDFIWSDLSYGNTSTTATTTAQWLNGFEIDSSGGFVGTTSSAKSI